MVIEKCRLCLSESLEIQSIFDSQLYQSVPLSLKIAVCISLPITLEDPFSKFVCKKCRMLVDEFYSFRESCMSNYINLLGLECSRVTEVEELMTISDDMTSKSQQCNNSRTEISGSLCSGTEIAINIALENVPDNYALNEKQLTTCKSTEKNSSFVSQDESNLTDVLARHSCNDNNNKVLQDCTEYQLLVKSEDKLTSQIHVENVEKVTEGGEEVEAQSREEEVSGNSDSEVAYSEFGEIIASDSQYIEPEKMLQVNLPHHGDDEGIIYYGEIDISEEHLDEDELEALVDQGLRFKCNNCQQLFVTASDLNKHYKEGQCPKEAMDCQGDLSHLVKGPLELDVDGENVEVQFEMEEPVSEGRAKWGEKRKYPCETCRKMFKTRAGLRNHVRIHTGERPFLCSLCTRSFSQKGALLNHERKHRGEWPYPCQDCGKGFFRPSDLEKHVRSHTDERPYLCSICSKGFHQLSGLVVHERIHSGERPYSCSICKMTFTQLSNKYRHMKTHAGGMKPFACDICHRKFAEENELEMHRAVHEGAKPRICHYCNKGFRKPYELRDHLRRSHTNERPYTCQLCNKSFFVAHDLKNHLYIHTGERPFGCTICSQTFTQSGNLKRHHLRHHPNVPLPQTASKPSSILFVQQVKMGTVQLAKFEPME